MKPDTKLEHEIHPDYEATIGIEVHVQLKTKTKLFCACLNNFGDSPNKNICHICTGQPGSLPVLNRKAVDFAITAGLATGCKIAKTTDFSRKHYRYPDLPKNFQITQGARPICFDGQLVIEPTEGVEKTVRIMRIHMEENAGKSIHGENDNTFVDLNRAGTPLIEIVTEPDMCSAEDARSYLMRLRTLVQHLEISDGNMEEGSFRADTNISVKRKDTTKLGTRVELKNINSFKFIGQAINYEIKRQIEVVTSGGKVIQETRLWDEKKHETFVMRTKEEAQDYRYFTEPDIPPILIDDSWIEKIQEKMPELPHAKFKRFQTQYGLSAYESEILTQEAEIANFFEATLKHTDSPKKVANWVLRDLIGYINEHKKALQNIPITPESFAELIEVIDQGIINSKVAQDVFLIMVESGGYPSVIIQEKNLKQVDDPAELEPIILKIIATNQKSVDLYRSGKTNLFQFFVGQVMKETKGRANPTVAAELITKHLK